jgi:hypothetical protein
MKLMSFQKLSCDYVSTKLAKFNELTIYESICVLSTLKISKRSDNSYTARSSSKSGACSTAGRGFAVSHNSCHKLPIINHKAPERRK